MNGEKEHLSWPELLAIVDQTQEPKKQAQTHKHLAKCRDCLHKWQEIKQLQTILSKDEPPESPATADCLAEETIAAYLDQRLTEVEAQELNRHIQTCDFCFSNLAHCFKSYQRLTSEETQESPLPVWMMQKAMSLNEATAKTTAPGWLTQAKHARQRVLDWTQKHIFSPVPGYSLAGIFLVLLLWQGFKVKPARLISFPESSGLQIFAGVPIAYRDGRGEWTIAPDDGQILQREPNFRGMKVNLEKDRGLIFSWPKMEGTPEYNFTLFSRATPKGRILVSVNTQEEKYAYSYEKYGKLTPDYIYEWVVSGKYGDGLHFKVKASFTVVN